MDISIEDGLSSKQALLVLVGATVVVLGIIAAAVQDTLSQEEAGLVMNGVLTLATLGYVLLTYSMVSQMQRDVELRELHQKRPIVIERLEEGLIPLSSDIRRINRVIKDGDPDWNGPNVDQIDGEFYPSYHDVQAGYKQENIPRFTTHISVDNGQTYEVYQLLKKYREAYGEAVFQLQKSILSEYPNEVEDSDDARNLAELALIVNNGERGTTRWDTVKDDIVPLRNEIPELMYKLGQLRDEVTSVGGKALDDLNQARTEAMIKYEISEGELDEEPPPDPSDKRTIEYPRQPRFASPIADEKNSEEEEKMGG